MSGVDRNRVNAADRAKPPLLDPTQSALFLDFDGSLVDIAPTPDAIDVPEDLPQLLRALDWQFNGALALVSGRAAADLMRYLPDLSCAMAGSHGAELRLKGKKPRRLAGPSSDQLAELVRKIHALAARHPGLLVEEKPKGVTLHYRAAPDLQQELTGSCEKLLPLAFGFELHHGKCVLEFRPKGVSKAKAVSYFIEQACFFGRQAIFIGDDTTDEEAMEWVNANGGISIKIGEGESCAQFGFAAPVDLRDWLCRLLDPAAAKATSKG
ncbi:MAG: trehalose-phosphatase [Mangrovicoccus sp.]